MTRRQLAMAMGVGIASLSAILRSEAGADGAKSGATICKTYSVADLVNPQGGPVNTATFEPLIELLQANVAPGSWTTDLELSRSDPGPESEKRGMMTEFFLNTSLIVRATPEVHEQIVRQLLLLRRLPVVAQSTR